MKNKKLLSILLAGAMIGTAPASAWAADFSDEAVIVAEDATEEAAGEDVPEQQEADAEDVADVESEDLQEDAEDLSQEADAEDLEQSTEANAQENEDPFSDGDAAAVFDDGETTGDLTLKGTGTQEDPYQIATTEDIQAVADYVNSGKGTFEGQYLKFTADITLPTGWTPIGAEKSKFKGNLDGDNHLLTVPKGEKCLLGYIAEATLKNLNIYGEQIASYGVVNNYELDYTSRNPIKIDNVTLKSGTQTLKSGFIGGNASGQNQLTITNSTIEKGVVIGYDKDQEKIGSFGGSYNGTISNCVSYADVYGTKYVGGICGNKGMAMGTYTLEDCKFYGSVTASGNYAGGICGGGYGGHSSEWGDFDESSAPNTQGVTIQNCYSNGTITGQNYVGGILGSETGMVQCFDNGIQYVQNNTFEGTVSATDGTYVGGVIGYINGLDKYNIIENNEYTCKDVKGIGFIKYIDTNCANPTAIEGVTYWNSENGGISKDAPRAQHNRTDDPLGADADKLAKLVAKKINVGLTILGDQLHDSDKDHKYHTYYAGNLETWLEQSEYTVEEGTVAKDVIDAALLANNMTCENPSGNYITSMTKDGVTIGSLTNGQKSGWMYTINGTVSDFGVGEQKVSDGDQLVLYYTDYYSEEAPHQWATKWTSDKTAHWHECSVDWCEISSNDRKDSYAKHTYKTVVTKKPTYTATGVKTSTCTVCGYKKTETVAKLKCTKHTYTWKTTTKATVFAPAKQTKVCSKCGYTTKITRNYGKKLTPTLKLNTTKFTLKVKQATSKVKVTGLANGDSVKSWTSSNKSVAAVNSKGVITAGTKTGTAKITVTLKSGKKGYITVTVQKATVKTTKITGVKSALTLTKGKSTTLKPVVSPFTSGEKVTYTSSNKNVAAVSSKGVITAKKKGTAVITVKSGSKKVTCKVTVK